MTQEERKATLDFIWSEIVEAGKRQRTQPPDREDAMLVIHLCDGSVGLYYDYHYQDRDNYDCSRIESHDIYIGSEILWGHTEQQPAPADGGKEE